MDDATKVLEGEFDGNDAATDRLLPLVYEELRRLASQLLSQETPGQTLQPTALVHEAYVRLTHGEPDSLWQNRGHFFSTAAEAMRRLLIEKARRKGRIKHGGEHNRVAMDAAEISLHAPHDDLLALDEALDRLKAHDAIKAEVVKLRFFGGLTMTEIAQSLDISLATAERYWTYARTWLFADLTDTVDNTLEKKPKV